MTYETSDATPKTHRVFYGGETPTSKENNENGDVLATQSAIFTNGGFSDTATIFQAFEEVKLDLAFSFSTQNSPVLPTTEFPTPESPLLLPTPSPPIPSAPAGIASPSTHILSRTTSFVSQLSPPSSLVKTKMFKSTKFSPQRSSSILHGSWPAMKYVGRGTPVDKNKRKEWSGIPGVTVEEDGLLFSSDMEATSLDSRSRRLSSSSEWDFLNTRLPASGSLGSPKRSISVHRLVEEEGEQEEERVPPLQKIEVELEKETPEDWASATQTVLLSAEKVEETNEAVSGEGVVEGNTAQEGQINLSDDTARGDQLPPEELHKLQSELQFDINIDRALDLGFSPTGDGGNLFTLAAITDSGHSNVTVLRTVTASSHSQYSTPSEGPSDDGPTTSGAGSDSRMQGERTPTTRVFSDIRSTASTKVEPAVSTSFFPRINEGVSWWKKTLGRLKRVHTLLRPHRSTCG